MRVLACVRLGKIGPGGSYRPARGPSSMREDSMEDRSVKLCECGCGQPTLVSAKTSTRDGSVRGMPNRYIHGHATAGRPRSDRTPPAERFWQLVEKTESCWNWLGYVTASGYGAFAFHDAESPRSAHRVAWILSGGTDADGFHLHHLCHNRRCVNPSHLRRTTASEHPSLHVRTHCRRGHEYTPETTIIKTNGKRQCRICRNETQRVWRKARSVS